MNKALEILLKDHPAPWTAVPYDEVNYPGFIGGVLDSRGGTVFSRETFTGDGDQIHLDDDEMIALVGLVNLTYKRTKL